MIVEGRDEVFRREFVLCDIGYWWVFWGFIDCCDICDLAVYRVVDWKG
jgi:hypothetical protein